jgi:hypothetical protein
MTRVVKYLPEQIERCRRRMQAAPAKDTGKSKAETADILAKDVRAMQKKGYTLKEVSELFREEGLVISVSLLERVLENETEAAPQISPEAPKTESAVEQKREHKPEHQAQKQATPKTEQQPEAQTVPQKKQKDSIPQAASSYPAVTPDYDLSEL